jgi:long-chain acyl-CoA synthetase
VRLWLGDRVPHEDVEDSNVRTRATNSKQTADERRSTMKELISHRTFLPAVERWSTKVAIQDGDYHATFSQYGDRVLRLANALATELGVKRGDRVAIMSTNSHQFLEVYQACFLGGGVVNPLNLRLAGKELQFILADSGTEVVFVDQWFADHFARSVDPVRGELPLRHVVLIGDGDAPHDVKYESLIDAGDPRVPEEPEEQDPVILMYTGGTTGVPKGALLDQRAEALNLYHIGMSVGFHDSRIYLHQTPMFHAASIAAILGIPATGGTSVFVPMFEPVAVMEQIEKYQVNWTTMVPTMIAMVLDHPEFRPERLASLHDLVYGASPMPPVLLDRIMALMPHVGIWQGYGMTESSSVLTFLTNQDHQRGGPRLRSAGRPLTGVTITVQDADGKVLPTGADGEICARAGNLMQCYWQRPEETAAAMRGGWYHTGDEGHLDADGYVYLVDRVKDMIVTGGENVYSVEVENALSTHPAVEQVAVIGIPDDKWGEKVHAVVVLRPGAGATERELIDHARSLIAGYKVPKSIEFRRDPLPLSGALKPLKRELRRPYWEGKGISVG